MNLPHLHLMILNQLMILVQNLHPIRAFGEEGEAYNIYVDNIEIKEIPNIVYADVANGSFTGNKMHGGHQIHVVLQ